MFALEINFQDGVSPPEIVFLRRPQGLVGSSDSAHVVVEDMRELNFQLRLVRELGRRFRCKPIGLNDAVQIPSVLEGSYDGECTLDLGPLRFHVTALDSDLVLKDGEPPDRAGVRIVRRSCSSPGPVFPAVVVRGVPPMVMSFAPDQPIYIGRAKACVLRIDSAEISAKHARMGFESGEFWIEDLGSTNGTYVNHQQISGRISVPPGAIITLGREVSIAGVTSEDQISKVTRGLGEVQKRPAVQERRYPVLISVSEVARPARFVLAPGVSVTIGRDPSSDLWLGAPHVSRKHCSVALSKTGQVSVIDSSTNGTAFDSGVLHKGDVLEVGTTPRVLDFGSGVTVAICFNDEQEKTFTAALGSSWAFSARPATELPVDTGQKQQKRSGSSLGAARSSASPVTRSGVSSSGEWSEFFREQRMAVRVLMIAAGLVLLVVVGVLISMLWPVFA